MTSTLSTSCHLWKRWLLLDRELCAVSEYGMTDPVENESSLSLDSNPYQGHTWVQLHAVVVDKVKLAAS